MRSVLPVQMICWCAAILAAAPAAAEDWPQFRGQNGSGVSASRGLPTQFSASDQVRWQATLGDGIASSVISGGRVFSTGMVGGKLTVYGHDATFGQQRARTGVVYLSQMNLVVDLKE